MEFYFIFKWKDNYGELLLISLFLKMKNEEISMMSFFFFKNFKLKFLFFFFANINREVEDLILIMCKSIDMNKRMTYY